MNESLYSYGEDPNVPGMKREIADMKKAINFDELSKLRKENDFLMRLAKNTHKMIFAWNSPKSSVNYSVAVMDSWQKDFEENDDYAEIRAKIKDME